MSSVWYFYRFSKERPGCWVWTKPHSCEVGRVVDEFLQLLTDDAIVGVRARSKLRGMLLKICVNGPRAASDHPSLGRGPLWLAQEAAAAIAAGAKAIHIHPKNRSGNDSLEPDDVATWLGVFRRICPDTALGVTTGAWACPNAAARVELIKSWHVLPDFASVNWHEEGAEEVAEVLHSRGVGIEAGIWHSDAARKWAVSPLRERCLRILIEIQDISALDVEKEAEGLLALVRERSGGMPILLHGLERSAWEAIRLAALWGLDTRIGLEDTLRLPGGATALGNVELVKTADTIIRSAKDTARQ